VSRKLSFKNRPKSLQLLQKHAKTIFVVIGDDIDGTYQRDGQRIHRKRSISTVGVQPWHHHQAPSGNRGAIAVSRKYSFKNRQKASNYYRNMPIKAIFVAIGDDIDDSWNLSD
jgi:hypothetical protein